MLLDTAICSIGRSKQNFTEAVPEVALFFFAGRLKNFPDLPKKEVATQKYPSSIHCLMCPTRLCAEIHPNKLSNPHIGKVKQENAKRL